MGLWRRPAPQWLFRPRPQKPPLPPPTWPASDTLTFETSIGEWTANSPLTFTRDTTVHRTGVASGKIVATAGFQSAFARPSFPGFRVPFDGTQVQFGGYFLAGQAATKMILTISWYDEGQTQMGASQEVVGGPSSVGAAVDNVSWTLLDSGAISPPGGAVFATIVIQPHDAGTFWVDDLFYGPYPQGTTTAIGAGATLVLAGGTGTVAATGTATAVGAGGALVLAGGAGTAGGTGTATAVGAGSALVLAGGTGTASGTGTATAIGAGRALVLNGGTGVATPTGTATAVGAGAALLLAGGTGAATGTGTALAAGAGAALLLAGGTGLATGTGVVVAVGAGGALLLVGGTGVATAGGVLLAVGAGAALVLVGGAGVGTRGLLYLFVPPMQPGGVLSDSDEVPDGSRTRGRLWRHYPSQPVPENVYILPSGMITTKAPVEWAGVAAFYGGHGPYIVTAEQAARLLEAGYVVETVA